MAWDEWEQLKSAARQSAGMQLDQVAGASGSPGLPTRGNGNKDDLKHSAAPWNRAAGTADSLRTSTNSTRTALSTAHAGMAGGLAGLASLAELTSVLTSWEERLDAVRDECQTLGPKLRAVGKELIGVDARIAAATDSVPVPQGGDAK